MQEMVFGWQTTTMTDIQLGRETAREKNMRIQTVYLIRVVFQWTRFMCVRCERSFLSFTVLLLIVTCSGCCGLLHSYCRLTTIYFQSRINRLRKYWNNHYWCMEWVSVSVCVAVEYWPFPKQFYLIKMDLSDRAGEVEMRCRCHCQWCW